MTEKPTPESEPMQRWGADTFNAIRDLLGQIGIRSVNRDPALPAGRDGSRNEAGELVYFRDITLEHAAIPFKDIVSIRLQHMPRRVVGDEVFVETVQLSVITAYSPDLETTWCIKHSQDGSYNLRTEQDLVESLSLILNELTSQEQETFIEGMRKNKELWLKRTDSFGRLARAVNSLSFMRREGIHETDRGALTYLIGILQKEGPWRGLTLHPKPHHLDS